MSVSWRRRALKLRSDAPRADAAHMVRHRLLVLSLVEEAKEPITLRRLIPAAALNEEHVRLALKALMSEGKLVRERIDLPGGPYAYTLAEQQAAEE